MKVSRIVLGMALAVGMTAFSGSASAQEGASGLVEARRQVTEAQKAVTAAKAEMEKAKVRIAQTFKTQNPDYGKAEADAVKAKAEIDQSKAAALTAVRAKPEYMAAVNAKVAVQAKMRTLQGSGGSDAEFNALAEQSIQHASTISKLERTALESDPKYNDAVARLAEANRVIEGFKPQIEEFAALDPDYMVLMQTHDAAVEAEKAASESMKAAVIADRQARAEAAKARAAERSNK